MSRAARETYAPLSGDDLPAYTHRAFTIREAAPVPQPGPERDILVALSEQRARAAEDQILNALDAYLDRFDGRILATLNGPRARKGTKWWARTNSVEDKAAIVPVETKARPLDADYIVSDKLTKEAEGALRPVMLRIAVDAGEDAANRLGFAVPDRRGDGMFAIDQVSLEAAVDGAVAGLLGVIESHAKTIREEIMKVDSTADSLDELIDHVEQAQARGGNWVRLTGRALANALRNESAIRSASALGVTHMQWISRRDARVRPTHVTADGTVRRVGDEFTVGSWMLRFPGDPKDIPASWSEVAGCRCGLLFRPPNKQVTEAVKLLGMQFAGRDSSAARRLLGAAPFAPEVPIPDGSPPAPSAARVEVTEPLVAYRVLDEVLNAVPGQWIGWTGALALALVAPAVFSAAAPVLAVAIPAGATVTVVGGAVVLDEGTAMEVVGTTPEATQARLV